MSDIGQLLSVQTGSIREVTHGGQLVRTGIFKAPTPDPVFVEMSGIVGDEQADLNVHGGPDKAVYAYPAEHYPLWRSEQPELPLPFGSFGENLTMSGFVETDVRVGDTFRVGTTLLSVTQPRMPCFKLGIRLGTPAMVRTFLASRRSGFYLRVLDPGQLQSGDQVHCASRATASITIAELLELWLDPHPATERLRQALETPGLSESWQNDLQQKLTKRLAT